jgi:Fur family ferric uptake transcriptional regulator
VCAGEGHTSLGEVYARAHRADPSLDRSTVYRALKLFAGLGLVVAADTGDGEVRYEISRHEPHHHLVCRQCGHEQDIPGAMLEGMIDRVRDVYQFEVVTDHLVLFGVCATCRAKITPEM